MGSDGFDRSDWSVRIRICKASRNPPYCTPNSHGFLTMAIPLEQWSCLMEFCGYTSREVPHFQTDSYWLVVLTILKNMKVNGFRIIPYIMEK